MPFYHLLMVLLVIFSISWLVDDASPQSLPLSSRGVFPVYMFNSVSKLPLFIRTLVISD